MKISEIQFIDGATGSELERRGVDLSLPLWSTRALIDAPETVNSSPYENGWFFKITVSDGAKLADLLDAGAYFDHCEDE
jgi:S-methylmethionine-dependent homocysteine/selenocysteine methylase